MRKIIYSFLKLRNSFFLFFYICICAFISQIEGMDVCSYGKWITDGVEDNEIEKYTKCKEFAYKVKDKNLLIVNDFSGDGGNG